MSAPHHAHLVGSIPLDDAEAVFRTVGGVLKPYLKRLPDGETGQRLHWIGFMIKMLNNHPLMEVDTETPPLQWKQWDGVLLREFPYVKFKDGADSHDAVYDLPYAEDAVASYAKFTALQDEGVIAEDTRFQICIPTPLAPAYNIVAPRARRDFIPVWTRQLLAQVAEIQDRLPNDRISIQWDVCQEVLMWENYYDYRPDKYKEEILSVLGEIGNAVREPTDLGYHLCYGSPRDEHLIQPKDAAIMVEMTHGILGAVKRPIQFFHVPVPKGRTDDAFFAPLKDLILPDGCELLLGLIHHGDPAGDAARMAKARQYVAFDGVGTECGWGRGDPERVPGMLESHRRALEN
jgi:hypothetical protein